MKRITIIDIAEALNITPSTVSRALAGNLRVSEGTRRRVMDKASELGYQPNIVAASLRKGKSDTIGMMVPRINRHFFSHVISAVEVVLNPAGYNLLICQSHERVLREEQAINVLLKNRVAGIIMSHAMEMSDFSHILKATSENIPVVQFDRVTKQVPGPRIINDNFSGGYMAVKHLIRSGYKRIGHLTGSLSVNVYQDRFRGYKYALDEASMLIDATHTYQGAITRDTALNCARELLEKHQVDAIFCAGDYAAIGAMEAIREKGLKVAEDIGVVGFANEPFADIISPGLTTVEQNAYEIGIRAANSLIQLISRSGYTAIQTEDVVPVRLLVRDSSMKNGSNV